MSGRNNEPEIKILERIYFFYHEAVDKMGWVCKGKCTACCTCNVTLTSLEVRYLIKALTSEEKKDLQGLIQAKIPARRFVPRITTNGFARHCLEKKDLPEEENDPSWGQCPLLENGLCIIYKMRPFGCRALLSKSLCQESGYAEMPPLVMTLNQLFLQIIEHLDQGGFSGNLWDMLAFFLQDEAPVLGLISNEKKKGAPVFIQNEKIPVLMVPPEDQQKLKPLVDKLLNLL